MLNPNKAEAKIIYDNKTYCTCGPKCINNTYEKDSFVSAKEQNDKSLEIMIGYNEKIKVIPEQRLVQGIKSILKTKIDKIELKENQKILRHDLCNNLVVIKSALKLFWKNPNSIDLEDNLRSLLEAADDKNQNSIEIINKMRTTQYPKKNTNTTDSYYNIDKDITSIINLYSQDSDKNISFYYKSNAETQAELIKLPQKDDTLSRIIPNLIKNSKESAKPNSIITITPEITKTEAIIAINNTTAIPKEAYETGEYLKAGFSTKGDNRGFGLISVLKILEDQWGGEIRMQSRL